MSFETSLPLHFLQVTELVASGMSLIHKQNLLICTLFKKAESVMEKEYRFGFPKLACNRSCG